MYMCDFIVVICLKKLICYKASIYIKQFWSCHKKNACKKWERMQIFWNLWLFCAQELRRRGASTKNGFAIFCTDRIGNAEMRLSQCIWRQI